MDAISEVSNRKTVRSWVQFEQRDVENKAASAAQGKYVGTDQDFVIITPAYGKDDVHKTVESWKEDLRLKVIDGRIPLEDEQYYLARYDAWKKGTEMPLNGVPIKGWGVLSPAQQKMLTSIGILTVEDLASVNDEGIKRIGMGAVELKRKANAWMAQLNDKGPLTQEIASVKAENDTLKIQVQTLSEQVAKLMANLPTAPAAPATFTEDDEPPRSHTRKR
jgi:hypothetical protein